MVEIILPANSDTNCIGFGHTPTRSRNGIGKVGIDLTDLVRRAMRSSTADPNQTPDIVVRVLRDPGEVACHSRRGGEVSYPLLSDQLRSPLQSAL